MRGRAHARVEPTVPGHRARPRRGVLALALAAAGVAAPRAARADRLELGGFFGPRIFSKDAQLGNVTNVDDTLSNNVALGVRLTKPILRWLAVDVELPFVQTSTNTYQADVTWFEPRAHLRFSFLPRERVHPYLFAGAGMPTTISSKRGIFGTGVTGEGYGGGGVALVTAGGMSFRLDLRVGVQPGIDHSIEPELEIDAGLSFPIGQTEAEKRRAALPPPPPSDRDGDGIPDAQDQCPDRAEDKDGFQDEDGCPDIDNDGDEVLDIADACPNQPETFNGYEDDDGCPDTVPEDVEAIRGTVEGLIYDTAEIAPRPSAAKALDRIAATMIKHPSIKVIVTGYADDREALPKAPPAEGEAAPDPAALAKDLSQRRAEAVRDALVARGVKPTQADVVAKGLEDPVDSNDTPRGRLHNRRVEVKFFVPQRNLK